MTAPIGPSAGAVARATALMGGDGAVASTRRDGRDEAEGDGGRDGLGCAPPTEGGGEPSGDGGPERLAPELGGCNPDTAIPRRDTGATVEK